jgi:DNA-binding NtrC family response regulator
VKDFDSTVETRQLAGAETARAERLALVVFFGDGVASFALPESGDAVVGRSREADIHVAHDSLSRKHAALKVEGGRVTVKDLGSQNGTKVNAKAIGAEWVALEPGDALKLGDATAVLQTSSTARAHRRLWTHGYFEARLEEECARAAPFALVRVSVEGKAGDASVAEALSRALQPNDCLASYARGELEALLVGVSEVAAQERADGLIAALEPLGVAARAGVATYPRDGREAERLLARACAEVLGRPAEPAPSPKGMVVASAAMKRLYEMIARVANSDIAVLILGETGSGKEVAARAVHDRSPRASKPYVALNCAAFTESLLESELFGHEKGAFTGASESRAGLFESAHGGTVFLDELGELPLATQAKLLRVLEEKAVRRVGGTKTRTIDVRFLSATNRDLDADVKAGRFRQDLFFRVAAVTLQVPALRERVEELEPLAKLFIAQTGRKLTLSPQSLEAMRAYGWPGNVRELKNVIERAAVLAEGRVIEPGALPLEKMGALWLDATPRPLPKVPPPPLGGNSAERTRIVEALAACAGNQTAAAKRLGISRRTLLYRLDEYEVPRPQKKAKE